MFLSIYGSPALQAGMGIDPESSEPLRKAAKSPLHTQLVETKIAELKSKIGIGRAAELSGARRALRRHEPRRLGR